MASTLFNTVVNEKLVNYARAIELGRAVARDIGGGDPERMAPPRIDARRKTSRHNQSASSCSRDR